MDDRAIDWRRAARWFLNVALVTFIAIGAYALYARDDVHLVSALPWLLLILYPLARMFRHHDRRRPAAATRAVTIECSAR